MKNIAKKYLPSFLFGAILSSLFTTFADSISYKIGDAVIMVNKFIFGPSREDISFYIITSFILSLPIFVIFFFVTRALNSTKFVHVVISYIVGYMLGVLIFFAR